MATRVCPSLDAGYPPRFGGSGSPGVHSSLGGGPPAPSTSGRPPRGPPREGALRRPRRPAAPLPGLLLGAVAVMSRCGSGSDGRLHEQGGYVRAARASVSSTSSSNGRWHAAMRFVATHADVHPMMMCLRGGSPAPACSTPCPHPHRGKQT